MACSAAGSSGQEPAQASPAPTDWAFAVRESPLEPWSGAGSLVLLDDDGRELWRVSTGGIQNGYLGTDGEALYFADQRDDYVLDAGGRMHITARTAVPPETETTQHLLVVDARTGSALSVFNHGFVDSARRYAFYLTEYRDGQVDVDAAVDGYLHTVWACGSDGWSGLVQDMSVPPGRQGVLHVGRLGNDLTWEDQARVSLPVGGSINPGGQTPCHDDAGLVVQARYAERDEISRLGTLTLQHYSDAGVVEHEITGWEPDSLPGLYFPPLASGVSEGTFYWLDASGQVYSVPVTGGPLSLEIDLQLPASRSASTVLRMTDGVLHGLIADLDTGALVAMEWALGSPEPEVRTPLGYRVADDTTYVSDLVGRTHP